MDARGLLEQRFLLTRTRRLDAVRNFRKLWFALRLVCERFARARFRCVSLRIPLRLTTGGSFSPSPACTILGCSSLFDPGPEMFTGQFAFERKREIVVVLPSVHQEQDTEEELAKRGVGKQDNVSVQLHEASLPKFLLNPAQMEPGSCLD